MKTSLTRSIVQQKRLPGYLAKALGAALCTLLLGLSSCNKPPPNPDIARFQKQLEEGKKRLDELEVEIKTAQEDPISAAGLTEDKQLLQSRMERLKEQLIRLGALAPAGEAPAGGGGHH